MTRNATNPERDALWQRLTPLHRPHSEFDNVIWLVEDSATNGEASLN